MRDVRIIPQQFHTLEIHCVNLIIFETDGGNQATQGEAGGT